MRPDEFTIHLRFLCGGKEYICTDVGTRTIVAVLFDDVREDWWLASPPYPGAMPEHVFDENKLPQCEPFHKTAAPTPRKPRAEKSTPGTAPAFPLPPLRFLVFATVFYVLGAILLGYCLSTSLHMRAFLARALRVNATVTSVEESVGQKSRRRFTPTFTFADATGKPWTNSAGQTEDDPRRIGEEVPVLYDPRNPADARIDSFENEWGTPLASGFGGLLMLAGGAAFGRNFSEQLRQAKDGLR